MPRQMPRYGLPAAIASLMTSIRPEFLRFSMHLPKAPTPGSTRPAASLTVLASLVIMMGASRRLKAFVTLLRFPIP